MPEFPHGKDARILMGPPGNLLDISQVCNTANLSRTADTAEVTAFSDTAKAYIGFRSVMSYLGRGKSGLPEEWN